MSSTLIVILCFFSFLAGQAFQSTCDGLANPTPADGVLPAGPIGWSFSSVVLVLVLLVHDIVIASIVWYILGKRFFRVRKTTDWALSQRFIGALIYLLLPPPIVTLWRMFVPRPIGWLTGIGHIQIHRPRRVLIGPSNSDFIVKVVRQALATLKMQTSLVKGFKPDYGLKALPMGLCKLGNIPRPLRALGAFPGRVFRPPRSLVRRDLGDIMRFKTIPTPITDCCDFLFTFTHSIDQPKFPQVEEAPDVPPARPSLVSFLESVPLETLLQAAVAEEEEVFVLIEDLSVGSEDDDAGDGDDEDDGNSSEDWPSYEEFVRELEGDHWATPVVAPAPSNFAASRFRRFPCSPLAAMCVKRFSSILNIAGLSRQPYPLA
ncbi:hypothetical protein FB45DRAFT_1059517 [Roridomyces roridus]|uniref:Uncharacterized protein n=1 Tax=Roridomyces roridus TaxID=1738132 RepID=A0AAD7FK72_9AGAR|nr:hypothetical protein FB45DRAFT_1059517 [Roridomyces roridus]